jgi:hypothetical protein
MVAIKTSGDARVIIVRLSMLIILPPRTSANQCLVANIDYEFPNMRGVAEFLSIAESIEI